MDEDDGGLSPQRNFGYAKIVWEIENCFCAPYRKNWKICSPEFSFNGFLSIKWRFVLLNKKISDCDEYITFIGLERPDSGNAAPLPDVQVYWKLSVSRGKERVDISKKETVLGSKGFMVSLIMNSKKMNEMLQHVSTETFNIESLILVTSTTDSAEFATPGDIGLKTLSQDMCIIYRTKEFSDLEVRMGDVCLKAHKAILTTANKVLRDAVGRQNSSSDYIRLASLDVKSMERVFGYLYTGNLSYILRKPSMLVHQVVDYLGAKELQNYFRKDDAIFRSKFEAGEFNYKWEITLATSNDTNSILSPFFGDGNSNMMFRLRLELKNIFSSAGYVNIVLEPIELSTSVHQELYVVFDILDSFGNSINQNKGAGWLLAGDGPYKLEKFISGDILRALRAVDDGVFYVLCTFYFPTGYMMESAVRNRTCFLTYMDSDEHYDLFSKRMGSLFQSGHFSDLRIRCGNRLFFVHKCILSVRSPVFAEVFQTLENVEEFPITDVEPSILEIVLKYIYTGLLSNYNFSQVPGIYRAAVKFGMLILKGQCVKILKDNLRVSNALDILYLAHENKEMMLKLSAYNYIMLNNSEIRQQDSWKLFKIENPLRVEFNEYVRRYTINNSDAELDVEDF